MLQVMKISPQGEVSALDETAIAGIPQSQDGTVYWIDLFKPTDEEFAQVVSTLNFHPLAVEDCQSLERNQPNLYIYDDHYFIILHTIIRELSETQELLTEEVNFFIGKNYLVTHHLEDLKAVHSARKHIGDIAKDIGKFGPSMLLHDVVDRVIDDYNPAVRNIQKRIDGLEAGAAGTDPKLFFDKLITVRESLLKLRRQALHELDIIKRLQHEVRELIHPDLKPYYADIQDTVVHAWDLIESEKDNIDSLREIYLSMVSHRLNNTMRVLTTIATIFMPMTLVASIYGMNFQHMPGQDQPTGFWVAMGTMGVVGGMTFLYLRFKKMV